LRPVFLIRLDACFSCETLFLSSYFLFEEGDEWELVAVKEIIEKEIEEKRKIK